MARDAIEARRLAIAGELIARALSQVRTDRLFPGWVSRTLTGDRRFGSRDRRYYRELIYTAIRFLPWIESVSAESRSSAALWLSEDSLITKEARAVLLPNGVPAFGTLEERALAFAREFPGSVARIGELFPEWTSEECPALLEALEANTIHLRAPLWIRVQRGSVGAALAAMHDEGILAEADERIPGAAKILSGPDVTRGTAYAEGVVEVQDIGSQWVLHTVRPALGERWLDACAGAGGKTLQLASMVGAGTTVVAHDVRPAALEELKFRAQRARLGNVRVARVPDGIFDAVLVDAPCTGSGTWRRSPHLKLQTTRDDVRQSAARQLELLHTFSGHVRPGGRLVYATCSIARTENIETVRAFLAAAPMFAPETPGASPAGATLLPSTLDSDGFFVSVLRKADD